MRNFIITEGQLSHLLEVIQTGAYNVTIVGKSFGENNNNWYVNEPKIVEGGSNKLPLNDLSKLKDPGGILNIKVGDIEFKIDLRNDKDQMPKLSVVPSALYSTDLVLRFPLASI